MAVAVPHGTDPGAPGEPDDPLGAEAARSGFTDSSPTVAITFWRSMWSRNLFTL